MGVRSSSSEIKVKSENIDRSINVVFFGLPENSLIEIVDNFLLLVSRICLEKYGTKDFYLLLRLLKQS